MNVRRHLRSAALFLPLLASALPAIADGGHHHDRWRGSVGVYIGSPWPPAVYYPPPVYYYPPRVVVVPPPPPPPPVYIEQSVPYSGNYWYYCQAAGAYYPDVRDCPGGWIRVPPR